MEGGLSLSTARQKSVQFVYHCRQGLNAMLSVAITGTLSVPREEAAALIDSTSNARFHPDVSYQTNYLVAALFNSGKARKAGQIGVTIITEVEMTECVKAGRFPETDT